MHYSVQFYFPTDEDVQQVQTCQNYLCVSYSFMGASYAEKTGHKCWLYKSHALKMAEI